MIFQPCAIIQIEMYLDPLMKRVKQWILLFIQTFESKNPLLKNENKKNVYV